MVLLKWRFWFCGLRFHLSYMIPGDADAAGPMTTLSVMEVSYPHFSGEEWLKNKEKQEST